MKKQLIIIAISLVMGFVLSQVFLYFYGTKPDCVDSNSKFCVYLRTIK